MNDPTTEQGVQDRAIAAEEEVLRLQGILAKAKKLMGEVRAEGGLMLPPDLDARISELEGTETDWEEIHSAAAFRFYWMNRSSHLLREHNRLRGLVIERDRGAGKSWKEIGKVLGMEPSHVEDLAARSFEVTA